ncbi:MAG: TonB-dependent receptor [Bacteroidota bacterium]
MRTQVFSALFAGLLLASFVPAQTLAQSTISGTVTDAISGTPLVGVTVLVNPSFLRTSTNTEGFYQIETPDAAESITFSFVGYRSLTIDVNGQSTVDASLDPASIDLQPVIVSGSRYEVQRSEAPVAVAAISARQIAETRGDALYEVVNQVAGVHMVDLGNEQHAMSIRQPISYKALFSYLEDGIPVRPAGLFNHNALIEVNMAGVERIEVVRGPSSSLFGSNAVGGAVNFITVQPSRTPSASVAGRLDGYGHRRADFSASTTAGKLGVYAGGYFSQRRDGWTEHSDFDKQSVSLRAGYELSASTRLTGTVSVNNLDTETSGSLDSLAFFTQDASSLQTFTYRQVDAARAALKLDHVWNARNATTATLFGRDNSIRQNPHYRIRNNRSNPARATGEENDNRFTSLGMLLQHRAFLGWKSSQLIVGGVIDRSPAEYEATFLDVTRDPDTRQYVDFTNTDSLLTRYDVLLLNTAAYAQFELRPVERLKLAASLRYDRIGYDYDNFLSPSAFSGAPDESNSFDHISPRLGLTYTLTPQSGFYANVSQGFLPPEIGELYRGVSVPTLVPATFDSYEAGGWTALLDGRLYADLSVYRMDGENEIISVTLDDGSRANRNAGETRHMGVEYALTFQPVRSLSVRFAGTNASHEFIRFEDRGVTLDGNEMDRAPSWIANAAITWRPTMLRGARVGIEWQHLSDYFMDPANTQTYPGYDVFHLRAGYSLGRVDVWANVINLTDELYATVASRSRFGQSYSLGRPRTVSAGVQVNL